MTDRITLGRTGLRVNPAGLGCGGHSRLGQTRGASVEESVAVVRRALELGVDLIDTAPAYRTEEIVGKAIAGRRDEVVISTKAGPADRSGPLAGDALAHYVERSLERLGTDHIDVFHLHGVVLEQYDHCREELVPALERLREQGKIRFLGITERFVADPGHRMLERALRDDCWDVIMVGFSLLNPSARERVFARTRAQGVGTLIMFAVRRALSQPEELRSTVAALEEQGAIPRGALERGDPLGFLVREGGAASVVEAAYRFCRHEPGADVILTGTGSVAHFEENLAALAAPALPAVDLGRLRAVFGGVDSVSGN